MKRLKYAVILLLGLSIASMTSCTKDPDNGGNGGGNNGGGNTYNGHEYVDLGLPSGTLWATCNVGADTPEGYGDYFAWGETTPKASYNWDTYKYCNGENQLTKYCYNADYGYNGFTDNLTTLEPTDDAAITNWGNGWRTPTKEEYDELLSNCVWSMTMQNGVKGLLFTASNGKKLFFPNYKVGTGAAYWINSITIYQANIYSDYFYCSANCFGFENETINVAMTDKQRRCTGSYIRPVRSTN